MYIEDYLE